MVLILFFIIVYLIDGHIDLFPCAVRVNTGTEFEGFVGKNEISIHDDPGFWTDWISLHNTTGLDYEEERIDLHINEYLYDLNCQSPLGFQVRKFGSDEIWRAEDWKNGENQGGNG